MSELAMHGTARSALFRPATVALIIAIGLVGFFGMLVLGAYAPELSQGGRTGSHAASNGATGFSGLVRLARGTGRNPHMIRGEAEWDDEDLVVATPEDATVDLTGLLEKRTDVSPTLIVLPKWQIVRDAKHAGWVRVPGPLPELVPEGVFAPAIKLDVERRDRRPARFIHPEGGLPDDIVFDPPDQLQVIVQSADENGEALQPLLTDGQGGIVLASQGELYILSDPDLLDNAAMKSRRNAAAAMALIDWLNFPDADSVGFDVVLNGLGGSKSLLRLAFDPPFLAMTLALLLAAAMIGLRALGRFGAARHPGRALAFGKAALVDNSAMLLRKAGKAHRLGGRYAAVVREQAVRTFGVSSRLTPDEVDSYLDALGGGARFTDLSYAAREARTDGELVSAARALHDWKKERLGEP